MTIPTFDGDSVHGIAPYRPGILDVGGGVKLDDADFPPDPTTMFTASDFNQIGFQIVALGKVSAGALLFVSNSGTPMITNLRAASSVLPITSFTVNDLGTGSTEIICPATALMQPFGGIVTVQKTGDWRATAYVNSTSNGLRVETRNSSGTLADVDFCLLWL